MLKKKNSESSVDEVKEKVPGKRGRKREKPPTKDEYETKGMTPSEYFEYVKSKKNSITEKYLLESYDNIERMAKRFAITNQVNAVEKLKFFQKCIDLEMPIVKAGYNHFVYRKDVEKFIEEISDKCVFIKRLSEYEREIPDEVIDEIIKAKEVFGDYMWVLFTDYTKKEAKKVAKERREKDPILFGGIALPESSKNKVVVLDRLYYICDWVDENCDMTLENLVNTYNDRHPDKDDNLVRNIVKAHVPDELNEAFNRYSTTSEETDGVAIYTDPIGTDSLISNSFVINSMTQRVPVSVTEPGDGDE